MQQLPPTPSDGPITESERAYITESLQTTQAALHQTVDGLSAEQVLYKPGADQWSIAECVEHITLVEKGILRAVRAGLTAPADPDRRKTIRVTDIDVVKAVRSRVLTMASPAPFVPTGRFATVVKALQTFDDLRQATIDLAQTESADLRLHYFDHPALGTLDAFQALLTMASHVERHRKQIDAIKASPEFPR